MKLKRVVALLMALCIILTSMPIGALASEEIADGTYAVAEERSASELRMANISLQLTFTLIPIIFNIK
jgi:hypothetical protein